MGVGAVPVPVLGSRRALGVALSAMAVLLLLAALWPVQTERLEPDAEQLRRTPGGPASEGSGAASRKALALTVTC